MTYQSIYDFYVYLAENKINLSLSLKKKIFRSPLPKNAYFIVKSFDECIVREYMKYMPFEQVLIFLENHIQKKISNNELVEAIRSIGSVPYELQGIMRKAVSEESIRHDPYTLYLIRKQKTLFKMNEVRKAALVNAIHNNKEWLKMIADRKDEEEMFILRFYLAYEAISENAYFVNLIARQENTKKMSEMAKALLDERIRKNPLILELLNHQSTEDDMHEIRLAYSVDIIREELSLFYLVVEQETAEAKKRIRMAIIEGKIRSYEEGVLYIQEYEKKIKEQNERLEEIVFNEEQYRKMFGLFADEIKEREYVPELKIKNN